MKITFVIPVLNGEQYIRQCIQSILSEAKASDEIIVVDNGSTDSTPDIVRSFENVKLLVHPGITVSALRNRGAAAGSGDVIAFIDSDCTLGTDWRRHLAQTLADASIHATGALCDVPDDAGWLERAWFAQKPAGQRKAKYMNTANLVVRSDVFSKTGGFNEDLVTDEDCEFGERLNREGYYMLENPAISVVHHGNPTSLRNFYIREKWHATSVLESGSLEIMNLPNILTIAFGLSLLLAGTSTVAGIIYTPACLAGVLPVFIIPFMTACARAHQFGIYRYIIPLTVLWGVFFLARTSNLFLHLFRR